MPHNRTRIPRRMNRQIGEAMHQYAMLSDKDRVLVAVSGGVDSLTLCWILEYWRRKAPIHFDLLAVHLNMGFSPAEPGLVAQELQKVSSKYLIEKSGIVQSQIADSNENGCYQCARMRRNRLFTIAAEQNCNKIAFGHHQDDIIETLFLNLFYSGNMSTMVPRQDLFDGEIAIIRPLAFVEKKTIISLAEQLQITPVSPPCPFAKTSKRTVIRDMLDRIYQEDNNIKNSIFSAMTNIKTDYLL